MSTTAAPFFVLALVADLPPILHLKDACIARMRADGIEQWDEVYPDAAVFTRDLAAGTLHVLREGDGILGCVTLDTTRDPLWQGMDWSAAGEPAAAVRRLMVHPAAQGRGLAKLLMAHAESRARSQGFRSIHLDCFTANPAAPAPRRCAKARSCASRSCSPRRRRREESHFIFPMEGDGMPTGRHDPRLLPSSEEG